MAVIVHRSINWSMASLESVDHDTLLTKRANLVTKSKVSSEPRKDEQREMREAVIQDADKIDVKNRDLVHGDGGTLVLAMAKT